MSDEERIEQRDPDWYDWRWQVANSHRAPATQAGELPFAVTPYYGSLIDETDPNDPIGAMVLSAPLSTDPGDLTADPIGEELHAVMPGLIRRYPDRALLLVSGVCPVYCRHCTRRVMGKGRVVPVMGDELDGALAYVAGNPEIKDVIVSGGDPLMLPDDEILAILEKIRAIKSVELIRLATRCPVTLPMRITQELAKSIAPLGPLFVNTQFNHPRELTSEAREAGARLIDPGIPVNNPAVRLAGVNDSAEIIEQLCRGLIRARIRPYYLFMCDLVAGNERFRTSIEKGIEIMAHLRGRIGGMAIPQLVIDLPGGLGKIPVGPDYMVERGSNSWLLRAPDGTQVEYPEARET